MAGKDDEPFTLPVFYVEAEVEVHTEPGQVDKEMPSENLDVISVQPKRVYPKDNDDDVISVDPTYNPEPGQVDKEMPSENLDVISVQPKRVYPKDNDDDVISVDPTYNPGSIEDSEEDDPLFDPDSEDADAPDSEGDQSSTNTTAGEGQSTGVKRACFPLFENAAKRKKIVPTTSSKKRSSTGKRKRDRVKSRLQTNVNPQIPDQVKSSPQINVNPKKQPLAKKLCKFQQSWLHMSEYKDWILKTEKTNHKGHEMVECRICGVFLKAHKGVLDNHRKSTIHASCKKAVERSSIEPQVKGPLHMKIRRFELKILALIASGNLSISVLDTLIPLLQYLLPQVEEVQGLRLHHTRGTQLLHMMGDEFERELIEKLKKAVFGLIFDETTDCSSKKQMATGVTFFDDEKCAPVETFFDLLEPSGGTAKELADCLINSIECKGIPLNHMSTVCADTCNTNFGDTNSVTVHLKKIIPTLLAIKCVCHLINLASRKSFEILPKEIDQMLHCFAKHFGNSPKATGALQILQELMGFEIHKILFLSGTRWLAHGQCVDRVLEQYPVLQKYFAELAIKFANNQKKVAKINFINSILQPPVTKLYLLVSQYVLSILDRFNKLFQSEFGTMFLLKPKLENMMREILTCYLKDTYVNSAQSLFLLDHKDPRQSKDRSKFYLGVAAPIYLEELRKNPKFKNDIETFLTCVHSFYVEIITQLKHYFSFVFTEVFYETAEIVNPALNPDKAIPSLASIFDRFRFLSLEVTSLQDADNEWRSYLASGLIPSNKKLDDHWKEVSDVQDNGTPKYSNLMKVINFFRIISVSNALVERFHSHVKLIKTPSRNQLQNRSLKALMMTKFAVMADVVHFEPSRNMLLANLSEDKEA